MPIVLYQVPPSPPCRAVMMTAQQLGVELTQKYVDLKAGDHKKPEFLSINPLHLVPTIDDDGFYLCESRAIMTYLINKYAPDNSLYPEDPKRRAVVDQMLYFDIGTLTKAQTAIVRPIFEGRVAEPEKFEDYKKALEFLEIYLGKRPYAAGDHLTIADLSLISTLSFIVEVRDYILEPFNKISAWYKKLKKEIPNYNEINDVPLHQLKEMLKSWK